MELLFGGNRDGMTVSSFQNKSYNKGPVLILFKNNRSCIFRGYSSIEWEKTWRNTITANGSFLFTLNNIYGIKPTKFENNGNGYCAVFCQNRGPVFGQTNIEDIWFPNKNDLINCSSSFYSYQDTTSIGFSIFSGESNSKSYQLTEQEVFKNTQ